MKISDITKQIRAFADQIENAQAVDPYAELKAAHAAGKVIQFRLDLPASQWKDCCPLYNHPVEQYRIKPDAEPATKEVELGPEDVRCGDEVQDARGDARLVVRVSQNGVDVYALGFYSFAALKDCLKIRRRDSNEFVPCSKEVPA